MHSLDQLFSYMVNLYQSMGELADDKMIFFFPKKVGFEMSCKLGDNLYEFSNPIFWEKYFKM